MKIIKVRPIFGILEVLELGKPKILSGQNASVGLLVNNIRTYSKTSHKFFVFKSVEAFIFKTISHNTQLGHSLLMKSNMIYNSE